MHHTKFKADVGLCKVITDLTVKGCVPCIPLSEHQPFDLIAVMQNNSILRFQVKYATLKQNGTVEVRYRRNWADKKGIYSRSYAKEEFDYYAIYCPQKDVVLYVPNSPTCPKQIRFHRSANNQAQHIKWADDYLKI